MLDVSKSSVSTWVRDIELTEHQIDRLKAGQPRYGAQNAGSRANREKFYEIRKGYQEEGRAKAREGRPLHLIGCTLYWADGLRAQRSGESSIL